MCAGAAEFEHLHLMVLRCVVTQVLFFGARGVLACRVGNVGWYGNKLVNKPPRCIQSSLLGKIYSRCIVYMMARMDHFQVEGVRRLSDQGKSVEALLVVRTHMPQS